MSISVFTFLRLPLLISGSTTFAYIRADRIVQVAPAALPLTGAVVFVQGGSAAGITTTLAPAQVLGLIDNVVFLPAGPTA